MSCRRRIETPRDVALVVRATIDKRREGEADPARAPPQDAPQEGGGGCPARVSTLRPPVGMDLTGL